MSQRRPKDRSHWGDAAFKAMHDKPEAMSETGSTAQYIADLEAEIARLRDIISPGDAAAYEEGMAALQARVGGVLALHKRTSTDGRYCGYCGRVYPCPTVRALDGGEA